MPILLTAQMKSAFDCMVGLRKKMGLSQGNAYVFATQKGRFYLCGWDVLTELSGKYQLENPEAIKSTNLQKHFATMSQILNLADNELDITLGKICKKEDKLFPKLVVKKTLCVAL